MDKERTDGSDEKYGLLARPLDGFSIRLITQTLRETGAPNLYARDLYSDSAKTHSPEDGLLRLGENETLQVKIGNDWLAVAFHPNRFVLMEKSFAAFRDYTKTRALTVVESTGGDTRDDSYLADFVASRSAQPEYPDEEETTPRRYFKSKLKLLFQTSQIDFIISSNQGFAVHPVGTPEEIRTKMTLLMGKARVTNLPFSHFIIPETGGKQEAEGIHGRYVSAMLINTLNTLGDTQRVDALKDKDPTKNGPYALLFDFAGKRLFILHRGAAEDLEIR